MIRPLQNYICVRPAPHSPSEIIELPTKIAEEFQRGEVIAAGPGKRLKGSKIRPMPVKAGDTVIFRSRSAKAWFDPKGLEDFLLIQDDDVLGLV